MKIIIYYNLKDNYPENDPNTKNDPDYTWCKYYPNDPRCKIKYNDKTKERSLG